MITAVDSSINIDVLEPDPEHGPASREALRRCLREGSMVACDVVWAEVATAFGHALVQADRLLTRDRGLYRVYFRFGRVLDVRANSAVGNKIKPARPQLRTIRDFYLQVGVP